MRVYQAPTLCQWQAHPNHFQFARYAAEAQGDYTLIEALIDFNQLSHEMLSQGKWVYFENEEPNRFFMPNHPFYERDRHFYRILSICPFTTEWHNRNVGWEQKQFTFIPFNEDMIPPPAAKEYDVIYTGNVYHDAPEILQIAHKLSGFNYRLVSARAHPLVTDQNIGPEHKLTLISQSRITVVHNLLFPLPLMVANVMSLAQWSGYPDNQAFTYIPSGIVPQVKGRLFEAAFCRSLILCRRDPWNLIERFFAPDEFVYYDPEHLGDTIATVLNNYDTYVPRIARAYQKAVSQYTTRAFFDKYLRDLA